MNEETLQFWGKEVIVEINSRELKLYIGYETIMIPLILMIEERMPTIRIPLKNLKRVNLYEENKIAISWEVTDENGIIYKTRKEIIELHREDAERLYNALSDLVRRKNFQQIIKKYKAKFKPGEIIKDSENVVIFRDSHQTATLMGPEIYEALYKDEKPKSTIKKIYYTMLQMAPALYVVDNIPYSEVLEVKQPKKVKGKYIVEVIFNDGGTYKAKFKEYGKALRFSQLLKKKSEWAKRKFKKPKLTAYGKTWSTGAISFLLSYWLLTNLIKISSRTASLYALIISITIVAIAWIITQKQSATKHKSANRKL